MIFDRIRELIAEGLNIPANKITLESTIAEDLGADSIDAVEMIMQAEDEFDISIDDDAAMNIKTIQDLVNVIEELQNK